MGEIVGEQIEGPHPGGIIAAPREGADRGRGRDREMDRGRGEQRAMRGRARAVRARVLRGDPGAIGEQQHQVVGDGIGPRVSHGGQQRLDLGQPRTVEPQQMTCPVLDRQQGEQLAPPQQRGV